jgi:hypothetical protein
MQHLKSQGPSRELEWAEALKVRGNLYLSHVGANDDWYWLYAVVAAKGAGLLVRDGMMVGKRDRAVAIKTSAC